MNWTRLAAVITCLLLASGFAGTPLALAPQSGASSKTTPLILEENEGERRAMRGWPGHPDPKETFILKVDMLIVGFVFFTILRSLGSR